MVKNIFLKYDTDRSGALNRRETYTLVNSMRASNG
jgi:Ca2+-binding EF-hand superfamily protein